MPNEWISAQGPGETRNNVKNPNARLANQLGQHNGQMAAMRETLATGNGDALYASGPDGSGSARAESVAGIGQLSFAIGARPVARATERNPGCARYRSQI